MNNLPFEIRGFNMCESLLRHTPEQLERFLDRMPQLKFNTLIVQYDYGFNHYQKMIREKCSKYNIDVVLMVFGPRSFFSLSKCDSRYFALDENGVPFCREPECETWPCFCSAEAMKHFERGAEIFLTERVPDWIRRIHMRSGDGDMTCRCPKCRNMMPSVGWHEFVKCFDRVLKRVRPDLESESDIYYGRYDTNVSPADYNSIDCVMYDTFGHHPRVSLGENPCGRGQWCVVNGKDSNPYGNTSEYHFNRLSEWAARIPGKIYIHDNVMMQTFIGNFHRSTAVMMKDIMLYRKLGLRGALFEAYEPGYVNFERHFEELGKALYDISYAENYQPSETEKMFMRGDLCFSHIDNGTSPELLELLSPAEAEYVKISDAGMINPTVESYRRFVDYLLAHDDTLDTGFASIVAAKRAIKIYKSLDFSHTSPETQRLINFRKQWDYMEQFPDHAASRGQILKLVKDMRDNVRAL